MPRCGGSRRPRAGGTGSDECGDAGDGASDDEGVHVVGALERVDGLGVGEVPRDAVTGRDVGAELGLPAQLDAVAAADLAAQGDTNAFAIAE